ncbi:MAG: hemerythrin domain-containing protein [Burkholderiales bacterium]
MTSISEALTEHHRHCDALFEAASEAADAADWAALRAQLAALSDALARHFAFEEEALFPAFEAATGLHEGPTTVMRLEHDHMRNILQGLAAAAPEHDPDGCRAELDNLFVMLQQHNAKEEGVLYPACDQLPADPREALAAEAAQLTPRPSYTLDLRALEPPEPFVRIVRRLREAPSAPLRVRIHREPFPLYEELQALGYRWSTQSLADGSFEILIEPVA